MPNNSTSVFSRFSLHGVAGTFNSFMAYDITMNCTPSLLADGHKMNELKSDLCKIQSCEYLMLPSVLKQNHGYNIKKDVIELNNPLLQESVHGFLQMRRKLIELEQ